MIFSMRQTTPEPNLVSLLRLYVIITAVALPLVWGNLRPMLNVNTALPPFIIPGEAVLIFLVFYLSFPWWQRRLGRFYLPLALILMAIQSIVGNHLTLIWWVPLESQQVAAFTLMLRTWVNLQFLVLFVAWQYDLFWVMVTGIGFSLLDAAMNFSTLSASGPFYVFYLTLVASQMVSGTVAGLGLGWLIKRQREHRAALAEANRKLVQYAATTEQLASSQERNRLARELHDTLAHSLSGATVQLEAVQALWDFQPREARQMLDQALEVTQNGLTEARRALQSLRASPLDDLGLALAVSDMAKSTAARANLRLELDMQNHIENLPAEVEQCIYRVAQEVLTNAARHADAKSLRVALRHASGTLTLTIADDGRGFDLAAALSRGAHYGLQGLRERAEMVGAALDVESQLHTGTTVKLIVPWVKG